MRHNWSHDVLMTWITLSETANGIAQIPTCWIMIR